MLRATSEAAGEKIDAAKPGEEADVEYEADMVQKHLFLYNEDLAVARDLWLRFNLSGDANSRLIAMHTPVGLGLPMFASPAQAQRMGQQLAAIRPAAAWRQRVDGCRGGGPVGDRNGRQRRPAFCAAQAS